MPFRAPTERLLEAGVEPSMGNLNGHRIGWPPRRHGEVAAREGPGLG